MKKNQDGFILIISLILLISVTILVVNSMRNSIVNEKMAGNYMDRNRAYQAAEQALRQASALLQSNADSCLDGCTNTNVTGVAASVNAMPSTWTYTNSHNVTLGSGQLTTAKFLINQLPDSMRPAGKESCKAYSIMGRGQGIDARAVVMLQTTAFVCPM
nr:PilX N-terminal domain-containing pilus assembly protein [uncultured Deefgea sp.]